MDIDIDAYVAKFLPWDLSVTVNKTSHATRPLTLMDMVAFQIDRKDPKGVDKLRDAVAGIFVTRPADIDKWSEAVLLIVMKKVLEFYKDHTKKNLALAGVQMGAEIESASPSGAPSPPQ